MGNTPSTNDANNHAEPQPLVASSNGDTNGNNNGGGGSRFRLPLYRGERDAFLPIDDDQSFHNHSSVDGEFIVEGEQTATPPPAPAAHEEQPKKE